MKEVIVFAGSNSKKSINKELAMYAASLLNNIKVSILDLNDYSLPVYGVDEETANGIPISAQDFYAKIKGVNGIIISLAEHNGNFSSAFKNLYDWVSRIEQKLWNNVPMLLMATSPGARGGISVLEIAKSAFPYMGGNIVADFSLPSFYDNFKENEITNKVFKDQLKQAVTVLEKTL